MLVNVTDANLPYKFSADVTKFTLPDDIAQVITPSTLSFKSQGDLTQHVIDLNSKVSGFGYQNALLVLKATYDEQTIKINTLHFEDFNAKNMLNMEGELQLGSQLFWDIKLKSTGITLPNIDKDLSGRVQGNIHSKGFWFGNEWAFTLVDSTVKGEINNISLNAEANIDINHKLELANSKISLDYGDIALNLKGYSDENWHVNGKVNIKNTELWLNGVESELQSNISISGAIEQPEVTLKGELEKLFIANISSDAINFDVKYSPMNNHQHHVTFSSERVNWNDYNVHGVNVASLGDLNQQNIKVAWSGDSSIDLRINSNYAPLKNQWKLLTNNIDFSLGEHVFKSSQPLNLRYNNIKKSLAINKHCWSGADTKVCLNEETNLQLEKGDVTLAIKSGTDILTPFIHDNILLNSSLVGHITVGWQPEKLPSVDAKLLIGDGQLQMKKAGRLHQFLEWQKGQLNVKLNNNNVSGNMALFSQLNNELVNLSSSVSFAGNQAIESQLTINDFNISPLQAFVPELTSLEGMLNTKLTVVGDLDKPIINGGIILTKGKAKVIGNINTLEEINMSLDFKGQQAFISGGLDVNEVTAGLKGNVDWQKELKGNFDFDGESLNVSFPPDLTITVSPHINAKINASELRISGRIEVLEGKLTVDKLPQGSVSLSKDVIIVNDKGQQVANEKPFDVFTNVRVVIADTFKVEGQGFIGRLGGELQVNQQAYQPLQLFGSLKIPEGRYRAYGQDLSVTKGAISFNGTANNPYVAIQATRSIEKENIVVGIDATGLANSMNIKLFSKPTMQQSETLSYLVRGRGLDAETSDSNMAIGVALGSAITNFSGVLTQIEKLPLINRIEIDGDDKQASIAGYLGDQVYIKYGIGIIEPINELTVRFYLLSRLWVETVSGLENSADLYYSFDIK
jgi:translocation and assembly module TamB